MSDVNDVELEPGETQEAQIASCHAVLKRPNITDKDLKQIIGTQATLIICLRV